MQPPGTGPDGEMLSPGIEGETTAVISGLGCPLPFPVAGKSQLAYGVSAFNGMQVDAAIFRGHRDVNFTNAEELPVRTESVLPDFLPLTEHCYQFEIETGQALRQ